MAHRPYPRRRSSVGRWAARGGSVAAVALTASLVLALGPLSASSARPGPPPSVRQGVLTGGPYAGLLFEISPGQRTIGPLVPLVSFGVGKPPKQTVYVYAGREDAAHRAVFVLSGARNPRSKR